MASVVRKLFARKLDVGAARHTDDASAASSSRVIADVVSSAAGLRKLGRLPDALRLVNGALTQSPADQSLQIEKALTLAAWGREPEARELRIRLFDGGCKDANLLLDLGWSSFNRGATDDAEGWMLKAAERPETAIEAKHGLASVCMARRDPAAAIAICRDLLAMDESDVYAILWMGQAELHRENAVAAEALFRQAISIEPTSVNGWQFLGAALRLQYRHSEAVAAFERAVELEQTDGNIGGTFVSLAFQYHVLNQLERSLQVSEQFLPSYPSQQGHHSYAHALLSAGRFDEGWTQFEFRWLFEPLLSLRPGPDWGWHLWTGQDLRGKIILLQIEQGYGDTFQFLRYASVLKSMGATTLVTDFSKLAKRFAGIDRVLVPGERPKVDYFVPMLSLPRILQTRLETIPNAVPYLHADEALQADWSKRIKRSGKLTVGLAWAGNPEHPRDRDRSASFADLQPLLHIAGIQFVSLQKGTPVEQLSGSGFAEVMNIGPELTDFDDTAAVMMNLDLVICVDTAIAHLAGALGRPVWVMIQRDADWRWGREREDTPWYPTMRLYRQPQGEGPPSWLSTVSRMERALTDLSAASTAVAGAAAPTASGVGAAVLGSPTISVASQLTPNRELSAVAETRVGILQYLPYEPLIGESLRVYGEWLQGQMDLLRKFVPAGSTILEVGAGVGFHSIQMARWIGTTGRVFVQESRVVVQQILSQNLSTNKVENVVALRNSECVAERVGSPLGMDLIDDLQLESLFCLKIGYGGDPFSVIDGAKETLWKLRPILLLTVEDEEQLRSVFSQIATFGYRGWSMQTQLFQANNFNLSSDDMFEGRGVFSLLAIPEEADANLDALEGLREMEPRE